MITLRSLTCISDSLCIPVTHKSKTRLNLFPFCKNNFSTNICNCDTTRKNCITKQNMYLYQACLLRQRMSDAQQTSLSCRQKTQLDHISQFHCSLPYNTYSDFLISFDWRLEVHALMSDAK